MPPLKTRGIVLKKVDFRETSVILNVLTGNSGKITGIIKGARSPKKKIAPVTYCRGSYIEALVYLKRRGLELIDQPFLIKSYTFTGDKLFFWQKTLSFVDSVIPEGRYDTGDILSLLLKTGDVLPRTKNLHLLEAAFEEKILFSLGFGPFLEKCVVCGSLKRLNFFSGKRGGVICARCAASEPTSFGIPGSTIEIMKFIAKLSPERLPVVKSFPVNLYQSVSKCLKAIVNYHVIDAGKKHS